MAQRWSRERKARAEAEQIAERAIRELAGINREYERFFDLSNSLLCTVDESLDFVSVNPSWTRALGWPTDELRGRPFLDLVHPDDRDRTRAEASRLISSADSTADFRNRLRHKDGRWFWLSWSAVMAGGTLYAVANDISESMAASERLAASESVLRAILDSAVDAIITIDVKGTITRVNRATESIFGYAREELIGQNVSCLMPTPYREAHDRYLRAYLETGQAKVIGLGREVVAQKKDGSVFPIELALNEVILGEERLFTGIVRDISVRKLAEQRLEDSRIDLEKSRDDLLTMLNGLRVRCMLIDANERITYLSARGVGSEWAFPEQAIGRRWDEVLPLDATRRAQLRTAMQAAEDYRGRVPFSWKGPSGSLLWAEAEIRDDPRDSRARIAFFYDISELHELRAQMSDVAQSKLVGRSEAMKGVFEQIAAVARGDWTVLVEGETGVGKELVSRAIHAASDRKGAPFIAVNCAGLTDSLLESQLFGHKKGAFTGALADQEGLFEAASGGTLLLDEIGDVSPKLQAALLRVIQEKEVMRVGETKVRTVDVRLIAATNRDLGALAQAGQFRQDLLYRIRVARLRVPPLRERCEDVPPLVQRMLAEQQESVRAGQLSIDARALQRLQAYHWPGNVRELRAAIDHAVISALDGVIKVRDLPPEISAPSRDMAGLAEAGLTRTSGSTELASEDRQRALIQEALAWAEGNRARAARRLGISRATLYRRLEQLGIPSKRGSDHD